ncbi:hypothetical protein DTO013E5_7584 [Penicillium roqueforti]|uniref:Uncharacterized protein family UPF0642 n=1 Tax=Penicillium roqueforti (strain FM164) TaxID=1365484 RepID=W6QLC0_PENRF|nr:uncharacterized protein LCP9604111_8997 [Penicillium roqueforti]CDM37643.1 Uncharacterised protein family UPF0642 [Penicillium roqueforti FM164]KAF9239720.1 hypothetical protein LCP9604111_8997 [Penicillium roqueforti]KAI1829805.1 hypothetical protein CBS147337_9437 [Penicillium roqueforti]KAI2670193.1 hypothetical protein CBS147355_9387 [Penicillium roqueforti]KAI2672493.1 hypothetical protein LCP963914a_9334 [Penicillium roqueforti]
MAKSVRASVSKRNRANLRKKVFGPLVDARTERLAAKLQELASQPRPEAPVKSKMDLDEAAEAAKAQTGDSEEMDIDAIKSSKKKPARVQKRNQKPRNSIVFQKRLSTTKKGPKRK